MTSCASSIASTVRCSKKSSSSNMNVEEEQVTLDMDDSIVNEQTIHNNHDGAIITPVATTASVVASITNLHQQRQPSAQTLHLNQHTENIDVEALSIREATTKVETKSNSIITTDDDKDKNDDNRSKTATNSTVNRILAHPLFAVLLLVAAGSAVSFQSGMNAAMRATAGRAFSSVTNFASGTLACLLLFALDLLILRTPPPRPSTIKDAPWYAWMGGVLGTYYIIVNIFLVPVHGAGTVLSIFVCSQVISACIMDHFGLTGIKKRRYSIWRMLASFGLIGCVAVITLF